MLALRGNQSTSRALNRSLVLNHLRRFGPTSRSALALATGLSNAAVTFVTTELLDEHLIVEGEGAAGAGTGRRPVPLDLNYGGRFAIGFKLMETRLYGVLTDFGINPVATTEVEVDARRPECVVDTVAHAADDLLRAVPAAREHMLGIGLAMSGQIDAEHGICLHSNRLGWEGVPIAARLAERTGANVWVDNDLNAFAVAEHLFGAGRDAASLAVATFGRGVGAALIVRGSLHRGRTGAAAELGHIRIDEGGDAPACECGKRGCLEALTGEPALIEQYRAATGIGLVDAGDLRIRAEAGDAAAALVLRTAGRRLGAAMATLASLFDPDALVIGGEGVRLGATLLDPLLATLHERMFQADLDVRVDTSGDDAWARGAAALAIDGFFNVAGVAALTFAAGGE
jgi:predicted NBD/HSP70 family sugar kinase